MPLDGLEGLGAQIVFDLAGVLGGDLLRHTQAHQPLGKQLVPLIDTGGDLQAGIGEGEKAVAVHDDIAVFPQQPHGPADAGLGKAQVLRHVDGADSALFAQGQNGLQIVFRGFMNMHKITRQNYTIDGSALQS